MRFLSLSLFTLAACLIWSPASAQNAFNDAKSQLQTFDGPTATSGGASNVNKASATVSGANSSAAGTLFYTLPLQTLGDLLTGTLTASAPFSDSTPPKPELGSVSTLTAGVNAKLNVDLVILPTISSSDRNAYEDQFSKICNSYFSEVLGDKYYWDSTAQASHDDPGYKHEISLISGSDCWELTQPQALQTLVGQLNQTIDARNKAAAAAAQLQGKPAPVPEPLIKLQTGWQEAAKGAAYKVTHITRWRTKPLQSVGISALGNQHSYSYVTSQSPTKVLKESTEGYGAAFNYSAVFSDASVLLGYSYERPYTGGKGQQVCSPIGTTGSTSCSAASVGAPLRTTDRILSAETRILLTPSIALASRVEYSTSTSNLGALISAYFIANPRSTLNGGLQLGWTRQAGYQGAVVVQKAFSLFD